MKNEKILLHFVRIHRCPNKRWGSKSYFYDQKYHMEAMMLKQTRHMEPSHVHRYE